MLKLSAMAVASTLGLLLASAITAAQTERPVPHAQMNRPLYPTLLAPRLSAGPDHRAPRVRCAPRPGTPEEPGAADAVAAPQIPCGARKQ